LKKTKGQRLSKSSLHRRANEALTKSLWYAHRDRRNIKRDMRRLWITRINAAARQNGLTYSRMIHGLNQAGVEINRKMLADMAINDAEAFSQLVETAKASL
jgi:large subunit ribosomal protein L20